MPTKHGGKRAGAGRKPKGQTPVKTISISLPSDALEALDKAKGDISRSEFILQIYLEWATKNPP